MSCIALVASPLSPSLLHRHCIQFAPKYMKVAKDIVSKHAGVEFYAVSCKAHRDVCKKHAIRGYPSFHVFEAGSETGTYLKPTVVESALLKALKIDSTAAADTPPIKTNVTEKRKLEQSEEGTKDEEEEETEGKVQKVVVEETEDDEKSAGESEEGVQKLTEEDQETEDEASAGESKDVEEEEEVEVEVVRKVKGAAESEAEDDNEEEVEKEDKDSAADADEDEQEEEGKDSAVDADEDEQEEEGKDSAADADEDEQEEGDKDSAVDADEDEQEEEGKDSAADADEDEQEEEGKDSAVDADEDEQEEEGKDSAADADEDEQEEEGKDSAADADEEEEDDKDSAVDADEDEQEEDKESAVDADEDESDEVEGQVSNQRERDEEDSDVDRGPGAPRDSHTLSDAVDTYRQQTQNGSRPGAGALMGKRAARDMDKWKQIIAENRARISKRRAARLGKNKELKPQPGPTKIMKANTPGTEEYKQRMKTIIEKINKLRKKRGLPPMQVPIKKDELPFRKVVKRAGIVRKQVEKVPVVKRMFKMSPEEELILDASLSFAAGLKYGLFMTSDTLSGKQKAALKSWLELMSVGLPPEWGLHSLVDDLLDNIDNVAASDVNLRNILRKHPLSRVEWSSSCGKPGFSCGMWKLMHTATVGIAEQRGGLNLVESGTMDADTRVFSPLEAADTIREYMAHFFGCVECRNHFIAQYDQCSFRRCDRLTSETDDASPDDWKQLPLWLWEVHNDVSVRVAHEKLERKIENTKMSRNNISRLQRGDEIKHLFPSLEACYTCFNDDGSWDEDAVFLFLEKTYYSGPDGTADKLLQYQGPETTGSSFIWLLMFLAIGLVYVLRGRISKANLKLTMNSAIASGRRMGGGAKKRSV